MSENKPLNVFNYLMANRHKQNEAIKQMNFQENTNSDDENEEVITLPIMESNENLNEKVLPLVGYGFLFKKKEVAPVITEPEICSQDNIKKNLVEEHDVEVTKIKESGLINDNEDINLEETFREEILKCGQKKVKKKSKKVSVSKKEENLLGTNGTEMTISQKELKTIEISSTGTCVMPPAFGTQTKENILSKDSSAKNAQPSCYNFFKKALKEQAVKAGKQDSSIQVLNVSQKNSSPSQLIPVELPKNSSIDKKMIKCMKSSKTKSFKNTLCRNRIVENSKIKIQESDPEENQLVNENSDPKLNKLTSFQSHFGLITNAKEAKVVVANKTPRKQGNDSNTLVEPENISTEGRRYSTRKSKSIKHNNSNLSLKSVKENYIDEEPQFIEQLPAVHPLLRKSLLKFNEKFSSSMKCQINMKNNNKNAVCVKKESNEVVKTLEVELEKETSQKPDNKNKEVLPKNNKLLPRPAKEKPKNLKSKDEGIKNYFFSQSTIKKNNLVKSNALMNTPPKKVNSSKLSTKSNNEVIVIECNDSPPLQSKNTFLRNGQNSNYSTEALDSPSRLQKCVGEESYDVIDARHIFPEVSHIQQLDNNPLWSSNKEPNLKLQAEELYVNPDIGLKVDWQEFLKLDLDKSEELVTEYPVLKRSEMLHILTYLQNSHSNFSVFSIFEELMHNKSEAIRLYEQELSKSGKLNVTALVDSLPQTGSESNQKKRKRTSLSIRKRRKLSKSEEVEINDPKEFGLPWCQNNPYLWNSIFAPTSSLTYIGNSECYDLLKNWLQQWKEKSEKKDDAKDKYYNSNSSDEDNLENTFVVKGPYGIGKSAMVYALANQLGYKVLEINASSSRQGKQILSQLSEATQSHTVSSSSPFSASPLRSHQTKDSKTPNKKKGVLNNIPENCSKNIVLILIEDIDIVFEDSDEGFASAINSLIASTKRPIILTQSSNSTQTRSKLIENQLLQIVLPPSAEIALYLQLLCLTENIYMDYETIKRVVENNGNDIRKTLLDIQFIAKSGIHNFTKVLLTNEQPPIKEHKGELFKGVTSRKAVSVPMAEVSLSKIIYLTKYRPSMDESGGAKALNLLDKKEDAPKKPRYPLSPNDSLVSSALEQIDFFDPIMRHNLAQNEDEEITEPKSTVSVSPLEEIERVKNINQNLSDFDVLLTSFSCLEESLGSSLYVNYSPASENPDNKLSTNYCFLTQNGKSIVNDLQQRLASMASKEHEELLSSSQRSNDADRFNTTSFNVFSPNNLNDPIYDDLLRSLPPSVQSQRRCLTLDYWPYVRSIARIDQLISALHKLKKSRRFLAHLKQLHFYPSSERAIQMSNAFQ